MFDVRKKWVQDVFLRATGMASVAIGVLLMHWLFASAAIQPHQDPTLVEYGAAALGFICLSVGGSLTALGTHIFDQVPVSVRWANSHNVSANKR